MKVEVRPLPTKRWHEKEGKDSFSQPVTLEVLPDLNGGWATGLTDEEEEVYSKKLGANLSKQLSVNEPHPYFSSAAAEIKLPNHTITFDTDNPVEYVKWKNLKASRFVANSLKEAGNFEDATHYIYAEEEEAEGKASKFQRTTELAIKLSAMSDEEKASLVQIVGERTVRGKSKNFIDGVLGELVETKLDELLKFASMEKDELYSRSAVLEAIMRRVLVREGLSVKYMDRRIGSDIDGAVKWFLDPENQKEKLVILQKLIGGTPTKSKA